MRVMILGAGRGTRLSPLSDKTPKPMLPIIDKPILELIIERLKINGFHDIVINTSHLSKKIENYFGNGSEFGVNISYSFEGKKKSGMRFPKAVGSAGGMKKIQNEKKFFEEPFLVICGDAIIDADLNSAMQEHISSKAIASILVKDVNKSEVYKYGVVEVDKESNITSFQEKPKVEEAKSNTVNTGIYFFSPKILSEIPNNIDFDIGGDLFPKIVAKGLSIKAIKQEFQWIDIGTLEDYYSANLMSVRGEINLS